MESKGKRGTFILRWLQGALIGVSCIIPGASGGVLAVSMGLYEPCVEAIYGFFRHFKAEGKRNFLFLLPLALGGAMGLLGCSFVLEWLMENLYEPFMAALIGLVLGGLPSFFREANASEGGFRPRYLWAALFGAALIGGVAFMSARLTQSAGLPFNYLTAALSGALIVAGAMLPGMSTSFLLMMLGLYAPALHALTHFQMDYLCFVALGGLLGGTLMLLFVRRMFRRYRGYAYYTMLGFLLGTVVMIFPDITLSRVGYDLLFFALGCAVSLWMAKLPGASPTVAAKAGSGSETE